MLIRSAKLLMLAFCLVLSVQSTAQDPFQRLFTADDRLIVNLGVEPSTGGGFYSLNASIDPAAMQTEVNKLIITKHDPKGSLTWAREYTLKDEAFLTNLKTIDITTLDGDTLMITGSSSDLSLGVPALRDENFMFHLSPQNGDILFGNEISNFTDEIIPVTFPFGINGFDSNYNYFASHTNGDTFGIQQLVYDANDTILEQRAYYIADADPTTTIAGLTDVKASVDSNYVLSFITDLFSTATATATLSSEGEVMQSNEYTISPDSLSNFVIQTIAISATADTGLVQTGFIFDILTNGISNFVIKTDSSGTIEWSKVIDGSDIGFISQVNDVTYTSMNEVMVTGKYINVVDFTQGDFAIFFNSEGQVVRQWDYNSDNSFFILFNPDGSVVQFTNGELENMNDGGMIYSTIGFDPSSSSFAPYFIKTDPIGEAFCQDSLDLELVRDYEFLNSEIALETSNFVNTDTFTLDRNSYDGFNVPVLTLLDTFFCPQDPIMVTLNAELEDATSYEWSTGETTPTIDVFEEGEYSVTVTILNKVCYALCDTSNITKRDFPTAELNANLFGECEIDSILLEVSSNNRIVEIDWSTGDSTNTSIWVTDPGLYAVTLVDDCGNPAEAQINLSDADFQGSPDIISIFASGRTCDGIVLTPSVVGFIDGLQYLWSTGDTTSQILVNSNDIYEVTVTNSCGNTDTELINIQILDPLTVDIIEEGACDSLILTAVVPQGSAVGSLSYLWSDGSTESTLENIIAGSYSVTVTDDCGEDFDTATVSDTIEFADVFFNGNVFHDDNRRWGPYIKCPEFFSGENFSLEVYNRFGNKVFESNNVASMWNGNFDGDAAPSDVYMYQYSFDEPGGNTVRGKGHVTIIRQ